MAETKATTTAAAPKPTKAQAALLRQARKLGPQAAALARRLEALGADQAAWRPRREVEFRAAVRRMAELCGLYLSLPAEGAAAPAAAGTPAAAGAAN